MRLGNESLGEARLMNCQPTRVPPAPEVDIPALHAKYLKERERRMRKDARADVSGAADGFIEIVVRRQPGAAGVLGAPGGRFRGHGLCGAVWLCDHA